MNDDRSPLDDEIVSAVLDGEATPAERALVEGSPEGRRRLEELRAAASAVGAPVPPLDPAVASDLVARAVREDGPAIGATTPSTAIPGDELAARRAQARTPHRRPERTRRLLTAAAAAAAIVVLFVAVAGLARSTGRSDSASDASSESGGSATAATADDQETAGLGVAAAILGSAADAEEVLARYRALLAAEPVPEHQFDSAASGAAAAESLEPRASQDGVDPAGCPVPPVATAPGEVWAVTAVAELPSGPVVVMADVAALPGGRVLVVDAASCTVLADGTS